MGEYKVNWNGMSGGAFWLVLISVVFYLVGMSTVGWAADGDLHVGLWDACNCNLDISSPCKYITIWITIQAHSPWTKAVLFP